MYYAKIILSIFAGYLLGSASIAVLLSKYVHKKDIRLLGSGNAGATNVARTYGMAAGLATLAGDILKTVCAMLIGRVLLGMPGMLLAGAACLIGHCWPVYFKFKGGKGVAVGAALALMLDWRLLIIIVAVFFAAYLLTKTVSVGSLSAAAAFPIAQALLGVTLGPALFLGIFIMAIVIFRHRGNIIRLLRNKEAKFSLRSGGAEERQ
jgi:glycerol-3-phosphate acyltransferase PlsY